MSRLAVVQPLLALAPRTATATNTSDSIVVGEYLEGSLHLICTAKSGTTPTLRAVWQQSHDAVSWADHTAMPTLSNATGVKVVQLSSFGQYGRVKCTLGGGTPSFTYGAYFTGKW